MRKTPGYVDSDDEVFFSYNRHEPHKPNILESVQEEQSTGTSGVEDEETEEKDEGDTPNVTTTKEEIQKSFSSKYFQHIRADSVDSYDADVSNLGSGCASSTRPKPRLFKKLPDTSSMLGSGSLPPPSFAKRFQQMNDRSFSSIEVQRNCDISASPDLLGSSSRLLGSEEGRRPKRPFSCVDQSPVMKGSKHTGLTVEIEHVCLDNNNFKRIHSSFDSDHFVVPATDCSDKSGKGFMSTPVKQVTGSSLEGTIHSSSCSAGDLISTGRQSSSMSGVSSQQRCKSSSTNTSCSSPDQGLDGHSLKSVSMSSPEQELDSSMHSLSLEEQSASPEYNDSKIHRNSTNKTEGPLRTSSVKNVDCSCDISSYCVNCADSASNVAVHAVRHLTPLNTSSELNESKLTVGESERSPRSPGIAKRKKFPHKITQFMSMPNSSGQDRSLSLCQTPLQNYKRPCVVSEIHLIFCIKHYT